MCSSEGVTTNGEVTGRASFKMREIDPSRKRWFVGDRFNTKNLLVVLEYLTDHAFDRADCLRSFVIMPLARSIAEC